MGAEYIIARFMGAEPYRPEYFMAPGYCLESAWGEWRNATRYSSKRAAAREIRAMRSPGYSYVIRTWDRPAILARFDCVARYRVHTARPRTFESMDAAGAYAAQVFARRGVVVGITEIIASTTTIAGGRR